MSMLLVNHTGSITSGRRPSTMLWGHTGAKWVALRTSGHVAGGSGGWKRCSPVGGAAYGTPRNCTTGPRISLLSSFLTPRSRPYTVVTTGSFSSSFWADTAAGAACSSSSPSHIREDTHRLALKETSSPTYPIILVPSSADWNSRHPVLEWCLHRDIAATPWTQLPCCVLFCTFRFKNSLFSFFSLKPFDTNTLSHSNSHIHTRASVAPEQMEVVVANDPL